MIAINLEIKIKDLDLAYNRLKDIKPSIENNCISISYKESIIKIYKDRIIALEKGSDLNSKIKAYMNLLFVLYRIDPIADIAYSSIIPELIRLLFSISDISFINKADENAYRYYIISRIEILESFIVKLKDSNKAMKEQIAKDRDMINRYNELLKDLRAIIPSDTVALLLKKHGLDQ
ncbi:MAG: hypothetical protein ARM1_0410 [Candidatus Micrarchaeota archaeon]|nr:MAG: hypothetical protein ARM1_0410 [Candidatus Micrarchaeota archaeon]